MSTIDLLLNFDNQLFLLINGLHTPFFDGVMYAISSKYTWIPLYLAILIVVIKNWKKESIWIIIALVSSIVISDQVSSSIIKEQVQRLRPSHAEQFSAVIHLVNGYTGGQYGFVSSHAANSFTLAVLTVFLFKRMEYAISIVLWAILVSYSRIYLGVHYPLDVLGGIIVGSMSALICYFAIIKLRPSLLKAHNTYSIVEKPQYQLPLIVLVLSFIGTLFYSFYKF